MSFSLHAEADAPAARRSERARQEPVRLQSEQEGEALSRHEAADVEAALLNILATCSEFDVPCAVGVSPSADIETRLEQGFRIIMTPPVRSMARLHRGREASGRTGSPDSAIHG